MDEAEIVRRGNTYGVGRGPGYYGVWDLRVGGEALFRFPETTEGWLGAWERFQDLDERMGTRGWRSEGLGWILLHLLIGLVLWFPTFALGIGMAAAAGRDIEDPVGISIGGLFLALPFAIAGWYLFVYLKRRAAIRVWILVGSILAGGVVAGILAILGQPPA